MSDDQVPPGAAQPQGAPPPPNGGSGHKDWIAAILILALAALIGIYVGNRLGNVEVGITVFCAALDVLTQVFKWVRRR